MSESPVLFLDANTLASPVTRTLVIAGARADGLLVVWSARVEAEADRHTRRAASLVSTVRTDILGMELSPSARGIKGLVTSSVEDRRVVADAIRADARYLITADVDDFAFEDLAAHEMSAVNPDYFMALCYSERAYREGVGLLAGVARSPPRTETDVHRMLGRRHPHLAARFAHVYDTTPSVPDPDQPSVLFRGVSCIRCANRLEDEDGPRIGLCRQHLDSK